ncbi:MAG: hypothetical protein IKO44_05160 [Ruminococcus sp.]|nr:hypothetical protein [Ruminococcus sp.]MBR4622910.1 hypothetical protein [Ruminococcus sp.]
MNDAPTVIPEEPADTSAPDSLTTDSSAAAAATESQSSDSSEKEAKDAGSVVGTGTMVASCVGSAALGALICFFIVRRKKGDNVAA